MNDLSSVCECARREEGSEYSDEEGKEVARRKEVALLATHRESY